MSGLSKERPQFPGDRFDEARHIRDIKRFPEIIEEKVALSGKHARISSFWVMDDRLTLIYRRGLIGAPKPFFSIQQDGSPVFFRFIREGRMGIKRDIMLGDSVFPNEAKRLTSRMIPVEQIDKLVWAMVQPNFTLGKGDPAERVTELNPNEQVALKRVGFDIPSSGRLAA